MKVLMLVAVGGAIGAMARYAVSLGVHGVAGHGFPYGTLVVNVAGSFVIGLAYVLIVETAPHLGHYRAPLMVGLLGAFTTFSAFSLETMELVEAGEALKAGVNVLLQVALCLGACWGGLALGRYHF
ncbi:MAG: fluoride efflux transporter CrcB [Gammaproteobacteria bacterium]|jgi:CrcB protein|nr:fluoride efflux transporter CrcB [Gammaproteobacteria bacterium]HJP36728.1 fluoride efflux transporter CrcB [Gammaproteobacteria bacterium]